MRQSVRTVTKLAHFWSETRNTQWHEIKGAGGGGGGGGGGGNSRNATSANFSATSVAGPLESYSGNVSNQDTTSKQHHFRIEITTENMIDHMLSEQVYFYFFFFLVSILVIPGAWSISKCCHNSIRISSWLRRNSHCGERRSHHVLYSYIRSGTISCHVTAFSYWISPGLHLLNTNMERWHQLQNKLLGMTCWKRNQNVSRHLAAFQLPQLEQCGSSVFSGIYKD